MWAISSIATEKLQARRLKETHILEIKPPLQIVVIGDGCEGYSPSLAMAAKNEITAIQNILSRPGFFVKFNSIYKGNPILGLWSQISFESLSEKTIQAMVEHLPELEQLPKNAIEQRSQNLYDYSSVQLPRWVFLLIIIVGVLVFLGGLGIVIWKVYKMRGTFNSVREVLNEQPNVSGLLKAGKLAHEAFNKSDQPTSIAGPT